MNMDSTSKIIRIKSSHHPELERANIESHIEGYLKDKGFTIEEESTDGFIVTYSNKEYKNENRNTLVFLDDQGNIMGIKYTIKTPE